MDHINIKRKMNNSDEITKLLKDPILVRIVNVTGIASLSILELLEYNFTRKDVNSYVNNAISSLCKVFLVILL
jgi:hypothetical protein